MNDPEQDADENTGKDSDSIILLDLDAEHADAQSHHTLGPLRGAVLTWQRSLTQKRLRFFGVVGIIVLVTLVVAFSLHESVPLLLSLQSNNNPTFSQSANATRQAFPPNIQPSLVLLPQKDGLACLVDAAWSPNSTRVAFLGYTQNCSFAGQRQAVGEVIVYDALFGAFLERFTIDNALWNPPQIQSSAIQMGPPELYLAQIVWSSDGRHLAVSYTVTFSPPQHEVTPAGYNGLILMTEGTGQMQAFLQPQHNTLAHAVEWDLETGSEITLPLNASSPVETLTYTWGTNGTLLPQFRGENISSSAPTISHIAPIGNPIGDTSFSIWQPGLAVLNATAPDGTTVQGQGVYTWQTKFVSWSPDGRYLLVTSHFVRITIPGDPIPDKQTLAALQLTGVPSLAARDNALQHILRTLYSGATLTNVFALAWRPDGQLLAQYDTTTLDLDLFNCANGIQVDSLLLPSFSNAKTIDGLGPGLPLRWSPNGSHLLLFDPQLNSIVEWHL